MTNKLYYGDNLEVLRNKIKDESVDLCYIDPPFNSKRNYFQIYNNIGQEDKAQAQAFIDTWTWDDHAVEGFHEIITNHQGRFTKQIIELIKGLRNVLSEGSLLAYLVSMVLRITEIHRVLKDTGSFYLHCDPTCSHYLKLVLDGVFCSRGGDFRNEIVWAYDTGATPKGTKFLRKHDVIFWYSKSANEVSVNKLIRKHIIPPEDLKRYRKDEHGKLWRDNPVGDYTKESIDELEEKGLVYYTKQGSPRIKMYLEFENGVYFKYKKIPDFWDDLDALNSNAAERLGYPTQKPEALLERIVKASSNEGDTILDAYCGCGTTVAVSQRLKREWIGIDITYQSIGLILKRLEDSFGKKVLDNIDLSGVPKDMDSAIALANKKDDRVRKEFEKWAVLTYSNNRAIINTKKGADKGVDGTGYFGTSRTDTGKIIFQVKSVHVNRSNIATLRGDMEREQADIGIFITLNEPTKPMREEAKTAGFYHLEMMGKNYDKIQIVTIKEMIEGVKRLEMPNVQEVVKKARGKDGSEQMEIFN